ncbi:MAG: diguanylate cyclase [Candidatus Acidiferrales bacterium]
MSIPGDPGKAPLPAEDAILELLVETLEGLESPARAQFLQRFFKTITHLDLTEPVSLEYWDKILVRWHELGEVMGKRASLKLAIVDVFMTSQTLRMPILIEYEELKKLQINAVTDPLTGLHNRRLFEEYFDKELNRSLRHNHRLALILLDLRHFKKINDRFGHPEGDRLLKAAAATLQNSLRTSDYAFRIGGDEFALLLPQTDTEQAAALARRLRAAYGETISPMHQQVGLGLDYGVAVYPGDGDQREFLMRAADDRLYKWKFPDWQRGESPSPPEARIPPTPPANADAIAASQAPAASMEAAPTMQSPSQAAEHYESERRKWERIPLLGTRAYAQLEEPSEKKARVLDLSYGGVALEVPRPEDFGATFYAVLHVPILPPVRVSLRRVYVSRAEGSSGRIGCAFVS